MAKDIFKDREQAFEEEYFRKQDAKLIEKMRQRAQLSEVAQALAEKLEVDDPALLQRVVDLGLTRDTGAALLLAPLVQVAWAEGKVTPSERETVLELAALRGIEPGSPAHEQLRSWLQERPPDALFEAAMEAINLALAVLTPAEREERIRTYIDACNRVAAASGNGLAKLLGMRVSGDEAAALNAISRTLRAKPSTSG
jgi:hypothetical protein